MSDHLEVRPGAYADSVSLMQVSSRVGGVAGVAAALIAMATELNLEMLEGMGFEPVEAGPNDLVIAIRAEGRDAIAAALEEVERALAASSGDASSAAVFGDAPPPRTVRDAAAIGGELALISTPGEHAYLEALDALRAGLHVMVFSDNVPLTQEIALKREAASRGRLVMGPDAGTAIVSGVGLGFANVVTPGPVGIVAASGTGAQHLSCLLDDAGVGVSHVLGVGGRDLTGPVGGISTRQALAALEADPATELIVLLSKPPDEAVAGELRVLADGFATPVVFGLLGPDSDDLTAVAETVLRQLRVRVPSWRTWGEPPAESPGRPDATRSAHGPSAESGPPGRLVGLFSGGTLCAEALLIVGASLDGIRSNVGGDPDQRLTDELTAPGHLLLDLGEDEHTRGRPHPMIDHRLRLERIVAEAADPTTRVLLLDVVLGHGAHPDPAGELAPAVRAARAAAGEAGRPLDVVVSLCATSSDPQGRDQQARAFADAGAYVAVSNATAARIASRLAGGRATSSHRSTSSAMSESPPVDPHASIAREAAPNSVSEDATPVGPPDGDTRRAADGGGSLAELLRAAPTVVTAGVELFETTLREQAVDVIPVDWRPPVGGRSVELAAIVADPRTEDANRMAVERITAAEPRWTGIISAREAVGIEIGQFLHAGPPITWDRASGPMRGALIAAMLYEGMADTPAQAEAIGESGSLELAPCHAHGAVGPMAGVVSPSMPMFVVENAAFGNEAHCTLNEGLGRVLRYGAYGTEVIERLRWMQHVLGPAMHAAVQRIGSMDLRAIIVQAMQMGDELHNRNRAASALFVREVVPPLLEAGIAPDELADVVRFINGNEHFFLNLGMPSAKSSLDPARNIPGCSVIVAMARNGTDFGIQVSGTADRWFTAPATVPDGLYLGDYGSKDANPDIGDSTITETGGMGGFAMAAAPAIVRFVGGQASDALDATRRMYAITVGEHPRFQIPILEFRGTPVGIDVTRIVRTGIVPAVNTGIAGRVAGTGQVGAGLVTPPMEVFADAVRALAGDAQTTGDQDAP